MTDHVDSMNHSRSNRTQNTTKSSATSTPNGDARCRAALEGERGGMFDLFDLSVAIGRPDRKQSSQGRTYAFAPAYRLAVLALDGTKPTDEAIGGYLGVHQTSVTKYRHGRNLRASTADRVACELGVHPTQIWPNFGEPMMAADFDAVTS